MSDPNDNPPFKKTKIEPEPTEDFRLPPPEDNLPYSGKIWTKDAPSVHITMPPSAKKPSETQAEASEAPVPPGPAESSAAPPPPQTTETANDNPSGGWPAIDRDLTGEIPDVEFPLDLLPERFAKCVYDIARAAGVPVGFVAMTSLALVAAAVGNARVANPSPGRLTPIFIWTLLIGDPSSGKSPALSGSLAAYRSVEAQERAEHRAAYGSPKTTGPAKMSATRQQNLRAAEAQGLEIPELGGPAVGPVPPVPQLICGVTTQPGLEEIALANPKGLFILLDEITKLLEQKDEFRSVLLSLYDAESHRRTTGKDNIDIAHFGAGLAGGIQPRKLAPLLSAMSADGLGGRVLPVLGKAVHLEQVTEEVDQTPLVAALRTLRGLQMDLDDNGELHPRAVPFTPAAGDLFYTRSVQAREMQDQEIGNLCAFIGKSPATVVRLASILTFLDAAMDDRPEPEEVDVAAMERAAALFDDFLLPMARAAFEPESLAPVVREARELIQVLRRLGLRYVSNRELLRARGQKLRTIGQLAPVTTFLMSEGVLRLVEGRYTGGRHSDGYDVNPRLWTTGSEDAA